MKENNKNKKFKLIDYKFKIDEFGMRSLNKHRNFMTIPEGLEKLTFTSKEDLYDFCSQLLSDYGCPTSAIFLVHNNGIQDIIVGHDGYDEENEEDAYVIHLLEGNDQAPADLFARIDAEFRFCCYGLMIERDNNVWEICS